MAVSRRQLLISGLGLIGCCLAPPGFRNLPFAAGEIFSRPVSASRVLVVVQLTGGNDGLNTVIPCGEAAYYRLRPTLAIEAGREIRLSNGLGLHPSLEGLAKLYRDGKLAIVQGVGYPNFSRSHCRSTEIWQTGQPDSLAATGWLGRYLALVASAGPGRAASRPGAVNLDPLPPLSLAGASGLAQHVINICDLHGMSQPAAADPARKAVKTVPTTYTYPETDFGRCMKIIAQMIIGGVGATVYTASLEGFDTHRGQSTTHARLLRQLSDALCALNSHLETHGADKDVLILAYSEFGRSLAENAEGGTDHGGAAPVFVVGTSVKGGVYGNHPSLKRLKDGDLAHEIDFRTVYATILDRWLGMDSRSVLGGRYDNLGFV